VIKLTWDEFMTLVLATFPDSVVSEDEEGQLIVHTGLRQMPDGTIELVR